MKPISLPVLRLAVVVATAGLAACDARPALEPEPDLEGNISAQLNAAVVHTDSGVVVNGTRRVSYPGPNHALWLERVERFDYGGFPELGYGQSTRSSLSWRIQLTHEHPQTVRGDSTIYRFVHHGSAFVNGVSLAVLADTPALPPGQPIRFENWVRYFGDYTRVTFLNGAVSISQSIFAPVPGMTLLLSTSGSDDAAPVTSSIPVRNFPSLQRVTTGVFQVAMHGLVPVPVLQASRAMGLEFDGPIDPARAFILLTPFPTGESSARHAFIQPVAPTDRVVIPSGVLQELVSTAAGARTAYRLIIVDVDVLDRAVEGMLRDPEITFSLPAVQRSETVMNLYLER